MSECTLIDANQTKQLMKNEKAILIDIRNEDEYARDNIQEAKCIPCHQLTAELFDDVDKNTPIIFHCQSGNRTKQAESQFQSLGFKHVYILEGGLNAWKQQGHKTQIDKKQPLPLMRQVQIIAGFLIVLGIILAYTVSPYFDLLSGFVGAGLLFAGISGFCGMANLLMLLPYNKKK